MNKKEEEFKQRLLNTFRIEAGEHLQAISSGLVTLEEAKDTTRRRELTELIYREVHSLKGAARAVDMRNFETICNTLESIFSGWKQEKSIPSSGTLDKIHEIIDLMSKDPLIPGAEEGTLNNRIQGILTRLDESGEDTDKGDADQKDYTATGTENIIGPPTDSQTGENEQKSISLTSETPHADTHQHTMQDRHSQAETVRISRNKLDSLMTQTEEMLSVKLKLFQLLSDLQDSRSVLDQLNKELIKLMQEFRKTSFSGTDRPDIAERIQERQSLRVQDAYEKSLKSVWLLENMFDKLVKSAEQDQRLTGRMIDNLLTGMRAVLMLPISSVMDILPGMVRNLSREQGKITELVMHGAENEVDRRILEEIKDPLIHLVRNCIDHGIEKPEIRMAGNKPAAGRIEISVTQLPGNKIEIVISDDGAGINIQKVKEKALREGIIKDTDDLTDREVENLIFHSGITTSPMITDLSGRGLGLAIVREKIDALGGTVSVHSEPVKGTSFSFRIPLTLATYRGIFIDVSGELFVIPTTYIERVLRISRNDIKTVESRQTIAFKGSTLAFVDLGDILGLRRKSTVISDLPGKGKASDIYFALLSVNGDNRIAFGVDRIVNEQEILVKHLTGPLVRVPNIGGVTVLGSGKVVPILNVSDLMQAAISGAVPAEKAVVAETEGVRQKSIMVAEDSITSRMLLKDILESSGFLVTTAVDGAEALSFLREGGYDLLVSDIDMPRMNGFELTKNIRGDKNLYDIPVVLVTALKTREDREHGMEVGANAYIEKSSFTPEHLLMAINKLI